MLVKSALLSSRPLTSVASWPSLAGFLILPISCQSTSDYGYSARADEEVWVGWCCDLLSKKRFSLRKNNEDDSPGSEDWTLQRVCNVKLLTTKIFSGGDVAVELASGAALFSHWVSSGELVVRRDSLKLKSLMGIFRMQNSTKYREDERVVVSEVAVRCQAAGVVALLSALLAFFGVGGSFRSRKRHWSLPAEPLHVPPPQPHLSAVNTHA